MTAGGWRLAGTAAVLLGWSAVVVPALPPAPGVRTAVNVAGVAALVAAARAAGLTWTELGVARATWRRGARWGGAALAVVAAGYGVALAVPALRPALADPDVAAMPPGEVALRALLLIPVGTVLCEEVAFRGVLAATAARVLPRTPALVVTAVVFGLWHLPAALRQDSPAPVLAVLTVTGAGGLLLGALGQRSGSLLAPVGLHLGTNSVGLAAAAVAGG